MKREYVAIIEKSEVKGYLDIYIPFTSLHDSINCCVDEAIIAAETMINNFCYDIEIDGAEFPKQECVYNLSRYKSGTVFAIVKVNTKKYRKLLKELGEV